MSTTLCYAASVEDVVTMQLRKITLLLSYFSGDTSLNISHPTISYEVVELLLGAEANPNLQDKVRTQESGVQTFKMLSEIHGTSCILSNQEPYRQPLFFASW